MDSYDSCHWVVCFRYFFVHSGLPLTRYPSEGFTLSGSISQGESGVMDALIHFSQPVNGVSGFRALVLEVGVQQGQSWVLLFILCWMAVSEKHHHGSPLQTGSGIKGPALGEEPSSPARGLLSFQRSLWPQDIHSVKPA